MKSRFSISHLMLAFCFLGFISIKTVALNYTISFTGSGTSSTVDNVTVQNITKGTSVTVPAGNVLNLSDAANAVEQVSAHDEMIRVYPSSVDEKSIVSFFAKQAGSTQLNAYSLDGRKITGISSDLQAGSNTFEISLPKGIFVIQVVGNDYSYNAKILNLSGKQSNPGIIYIGKEKNVSSGPQKTKSSTFGIIRMTYIAGDQLLYTATSGTYITSVPDIPSANKTVNFVFSILPTSIIPAGTFTMGSPETEVGRNSDETQHTVTLSAFRMSKYDITNSQYAAFLNTKGISSNGLGTDIVYYGQALISESDWGLHYSGSQWIPVAGYENNPVIFVSWYGAMEFATYVGGTLPTEAQWEYACRAGTTTPFNTGNFLTNLQANYDWSQPYNGGTNTVTTSPGRTLPVGSYPANGYGLYDMHGNVYQWCSDGYDDYPTTDQTNPTGAFNDIVRVYRGGSWNWNAEYCRSARRSCNILHDGLSNVGFRVAFVP